MKILFALILMFSLGCTEGLKVYSKLEGFRILGITADFPEVNTAQTVSLTPFVSFPEAAPSTTLQVEYEACRDPGTAFGAKPECNTPIEILVRKASYSFPVSNFPAGSMNTGSTTSFDVSIPASLIASINDPSVFLPTLAHNGVSVLVLVNIFDTSKPSEVIKSFKRINITTRPNINTNPSFSGFSDSEGASLSAFPTTPLSIKVASPSVPETYDQYDTGGSLKGLEEELTVSWFATNGDFALSRTDPDGASEFEPGEAVDGIIVGILRDNRGGIEIKSQIF